MKLNTVFVLLICLAFLLSFGCAGQNQNPPPANKSNISNSVNKSPNQESPKTETNLETYSNLDLGLKVNYPKGIKPKETIKNGEGFIDFISPEKNANGALFGVTIAVQDLSGVNPPLTLQEYTVDSLNTIKKQFGVNLTESYDTTLSTFPGHAIVYSIRNDEINFKFMQVYTIKDNKAYVVTYISQPEYFSRFLPDAQQMFVSFEITAQANVQNSAVTIRENESIDLCGWHVAVDEFFELDGKLRADIAVFQNGKPFIGGYAVGDTVQIGFDNEQCNYTVVNVQKPENGSGYVMLSRK